MRHPTVVEAYLTCARTLAVGQRGVQAIADGVWLGVLSRENLARIDEAYYRGQGMYRNDAYNRSGLLWWEQNFADRYLAGARRIAVTGAGGGREVHALAHADHEVVGFECHEELARAGTRLLAEDGLPGTLRPMLRDRWPAGHGPFDALIVGWGSYTLMADRAQRVSFLADAAGDLRPGAPVLLSFFVTGGLGRQLRTSAAIGNALRRIGGRPPVEPGDALDPNFVHYFTREQVVAEVRAAGLELQTFSATGYGHAVARVPGADGVRGSGSVAR